MLGTMDRGRGFLFSSHSLSDAIRSTQLKLQQEIESMDGNRLLNTAPADLAAYFGDVHKITAITLQRDDWYVDTKEIQIDVRGDPTRAIFDSSRPVLIPGERTEVRIPFTGEAELFYYQSNNFTTSAPRAEIEKNELVLRFDQPSDSPCELRPLIDRQIQEIEQYLSWQRPMIDGHNASLSRLAETAIEQRRSRLLAQSQRVSSLGIPVKRREDAPKTYAIPTVRKKATPALPPASASPFAPEPTWAMEQYEQALKIVSDMALVMERSPDAFKTMNEEALRQHFLMQLNGQFEGKATGETFNMSGKTDILLREGDRNVFIAECKFWKGPKGFSEAIDQLLSYTTWRDVKTAILVFNKDVSMSTALSGVDSTAKAHPNFKRGVAWSNEGGYRYVFHSNGDKNRELIVSVLVFHVPA